MFSEILFLAKKFRKQASNLNEATKELKDLGNFAKMKDSWDGLTEVSTARIFYQELKDRGFERTKIIEVTKMIFRLRQELSEFRVLAMPALDDQFDMIRLPYTIYGAGGNLIEIFAEKMKQLGGSKSFSDIHLQKFFQAIKDYHKLYTQTRTNAPVDLKLYARLIYLNDTELIGILKGKLEKKINELKDKLDAQNADLGIHFTKLYNAILNNKIQETNQGEIDSFKIPLHSNIEDKLHSLIDESDTVRECLQEFDRFLFYIFGFSPDKSKNAAVKKAWIGLIYTVREIFDKKYYEVILKLTSHMQELDRSKALAESEMLEIKHLFKWE